MPAQSIPVPDWAIHLIAIVIMGIIAAYVRLLVKSVTDHQSRQDLEIGGLRKFSHWVSDSLMTISAKTNIKLPPKAFAIALLLVSTVAAGFAIQKATIAETFCTPDGGNGSLRCGGTAYMACVELHEDICTSDDVLPGCCAASPDSADRTAKNCHCCAGAKKASLTIPYDSLD